MLASKTILLVDDEYVMRHILKGILKPIGDFNFLESSNGMKCIELMLEENPDLVFLDVIMPVMDGIQTLQKIKNIDEIKDIPIIMCTSESSVKNVQKAIKLGVVDYIIKPFTMETIQEKTIKWLSLP